MRSRSSTIPERPSQRGESRGDHLAAQLLGRAPRSSGDGQLGDQHLVGTAGGVVRPRRVRVLPSLRAQPLAASGLSAWPTSLGSSPLRRATSGISTAPALRPTARTILRSGSTPSCGPLAPEPVLFSALLADRDQALAGEGQAGGRDLGLIDAKLGRQVEDRQRRGLGAERAQDLIVDLG